MVNFFQSVGYALGKLHTGMLCYLCHLCNDDNKGPFDSLWNALGVPLQPRCLLPLREHLGIDLVVFDGERNTPLLAIETKVDDHEHRSPDPTIGRGAKDWQTVVYAKVLLRHYPHFQNFLFLTFGVGEFFHPPHEKLFHAVGLERFHGALAAIHSTDKLITDWQEVVCHEVDLRRRVDVNNQAEADYRGEARNWNLVLLGGLKELLRPIIGADRYWDATVYAYGPDTILNFGRKAYPLYMEINKNGKLNLKVDLNDRAIAQKLAGRCQKMAEFWADRLGSVPPLKTRSGACRTLLSFDVGLGPSPRWFWYRVDREETARSVGRILEAFFASRNQEEFGRAFLDPL